MRHLDGKSKSSCVITSERFFFWFCLALVDFLRQLSGWRGFSLRQLMAGGQDGRATSELSLFDIRGPAEILAIVRRPWQGNRAGDVNVGRLGVMKDPWPLRISSYVSGASRWSQHRDWPWTDYMYTNARILRISAGTAGHLKATWSHRAGRCWIINLTSGQSSHISHLPLPSIGGKPQALPR